MTKIARLLAACTIALVALPLLTIPRPASAVSDTTIDRDVDATLATLYAQNPSAKTLGARAKGILVFPRVYKAGLFFGGHYGEGSLRVRGATVGYYSTTAVTYGLQAGAQYYGYAMFFMNDSALNYLESSDGWEVGSGPSVVVLDQGTAATVTSTTMDKDAYAYIFGQQGLMAGMGLQGSKISHITP